MTVVARKDFARMCGMEPRQLSVHIDRQEVVVVNKMVDLSNSVNQEFLEKRTGQNITVKEGKPPSKKDLERAERISQLNTKKRELENEKILEEIQTIRLKKQKQEGYLIPTDLVKTILSTLSRSLTITFHQGAEELIVQISKKKRLSRQETVDLKKKLVDILNKAVNEGVDMTQKNLETIVKSISGKKK